ncbi:hypothetical protein NQ315_016163 [Exocentrus adspersus]|uniref:Uncharacterized protein n=1 Tax=Exocentrus adspersus TaxID=1586481 RepID=A0AAV8VGX1_9CUCU|nr:hypothetical protein NQ315_016163 [Exocentrus adspersus]
MVETKLTILIPSMSPGTIMRLYLIGTLLCIVLLRCCRANPIITVTAEHDHDSRSVEVTTDVGKEGQIQENTPGVFKTEESKQVPSKEHTPDEVKKIGSGGGDDDDDDDEADDDDEDEDVPVASPSSGVAQPAPAAEVDSVVEPVAAASELSPSEELDAQEAAAGEDEQGAGTEAAGAEGNLIEKDPEVDASDTVENTVEPVVVQPVPANDETAADDDDDDDDDEYDDDDADDDDYDDDDDGVLDALARRSRESKSLKHSKRSKKARKHHQAKGASKVR